MSTAAADVSSTTDDNGLRVATTDDHLDELRLVTRELVTRGVSAKSIKEVVAIAIAAGPFRD